MTSNLDKMRKELKDRFEAAKRNNPDNKDEFDIDWKKKRVLPTPTGKVIIYGKVNEQFLEDVISGKARVPPETHKQLNRLEISERCKIFRSAFRKPDPYLINRAIENLGSEVLDATGKTLAATCECIRSLNYIIDEEKPPIKNVKRISNKLTVLQSLCHQQMGGLRFGRKPRAGKTRVGSEILRSLYG